MKKNLLQKSCSFSVKNPQLSFKLAVISALISYSTLNLNAATIYINRDTNWSEITGGSGLGGKPNANDIIINQHSILTIDVNNAECASLTIGGPGKYGALNFISSGFLTVSGSVTFQGNKINTFDMTNGGILKCAGIILTNSNLIWAAGLGTIELTAPNTLPSSGFTRFNNLIISGGTTILGTSITVIGNLTQNAGNITVNNGDTLAVNGTHTAGTNIVSGAGTYRLANTGVLITANLAGITTSGASGTIQTATRNFNSANYTFNGGANQVSGNALPATLATLNIQNNSGVFTFTNASTNVTTLNLAPGAKLTINVGQTVNATQLNIQSSAAGTATILNNGTFNPTQTTAQQYVDTIRNWYLSPVVASATPAGIGANPIYRWAENGTPQNWIAASSLSKGVGYILRPASVRSIFSYTGILNDGDISMPLTRTPNTAKAGFNLIGNPYPSFLNVANPINGNALLEKTIWYRTTSTTNNKLYYFETLNTASGIGTNLSGRGTVTGIVPPMQTFWVRATGNTTLNFSNANRSHAGVSPNPLRVTSATADVQQDIRLSVTNGIAMDEAILVFNENATDGLDIYDSEKWTNNNAAIPEIYTKVGNKELAINGMDLPEPVEYINLGFRTTDATVRTYTISLTETTNFEPGTQIILYDGAVPNYLNPGDSYSFISGAINDPDRFTIIIKSPGTSTSLKNNSAGNVSILTNDQGQVSVFINADIASDAKVTLYTMSGQIVKSQLISASKTNIDAPNGIYLVKVTNAGHSTSAKVVIQ